MLEIRLLGQFDVRRDGTSVDLTDRAEQALLAYLALTTGTRHRREKLAGMLWPDFDEARARKNFNNYLYRLRRALADEHLQADRLNICFATDKDCWIDTREFEAGDSPPVSMERLANCLSIYQGELLPGFYDEWVVRRRQIFQNMYDRRSQFLLERLIETEGWPEVIECAERWIAMSYAPEPAYRALMLAYGATGDMAKVEIVWQRCVADLEQELSVEPSDYTQETYERLLKGATPSQPGSVIIRQGAPAEAIRDLLRQWHQQDIQTLGLPQLAILSACPDRLDLEQDEADLMFRSVIQHGLDVRHSLADASTPQVALGALVSAMSGHPHLLGRLQIVQALKDLAMPEADRLLLALVDEDETERVRTRAALAACERGHRDEVIRKLARAAGQDSIGLAAFVAVVDRYGLPDRSVPYPRLTVALQLAQWRLGRNSGAIGKQVFRAALGAGLVLTPHGAAAPLYSKLLFSEGYNLRQQMIRQFGWKPQVWGLQGALDMLLIGGLQGASTGYLVGLADAFWLHPARRRRWRLVLGSLSGLFASVYIISFSYAGLLDPPTAAFRYLIPVTLVYGLLLGMTLSIAVPTLGTYPPWREQWKRGAVSIILAMLVTAGYTYLIYLNFVNRVLLQQLVFAFLLSLGISLGLSKRPRRTF